MNSRPRVITFAFLLLYITFSFIYPGEIVPALAPYRLTFIVGMAGLVVAALSLLVRRGELLTTPQLWCLIAFSAMLGVSRMVADRWLGAPIMAFQRFGPSLTMFVLAAWG